MTTELTYENYLKHYGVKGMKWGVRRSEEQLAAARGARKTERAKATRDTADYMNKNKVRNYGSIVGASILGTPLVGGAVAGAQIARASGYSKGKSVAIGVLGNVPGGIIAAEVQVRKRANASVSG